jgi:hypothetical protein
VISVKSLRLDPCILALIFLTIFGFVLRIYDLGQQSLWYDEGYSINAAMAMLDKGAPILPSGWFYSHGILNTSLIAASMGIFGETEFAARLPSVIFGTLTIPLVFFFAKKIGGKRTALIAAFLVTFLAIEIAWSRQARMYQQLQFFYILSLYLFYLFTQKRSNKLLVLTILSTICAALSHTFGFSLILVYVAYLLLTNIKNFRKYMNKGLFKRKQTLIFLLCVAILLILGQALFQVFSSAWGIKVNYFTEYTDYLTEILPVILYLGAVGIVIMFKRDARTSLLLLLALVIPFYFVCFHVKMLSMRYLYFFMPILIIYFAYTVTYVCDTLAHAVTKRAGGTAKATRTTLLKSWLSPALTVVVLGLSLHGSGFGFLPQSNHYLETTAPQPDFKLAYNFINDNLKEGDIIIDTWPTVGIFYLEKAPDFWLAFDIAGTSGVYCIGDTYSHDRYTNIYCIKNTGELEAAVNALPRGWLVIDGLASYRLPQSTLDFIEGNLTYYEEGSRATIKVYGWNNISASEDQ